METLRELYDKKGGYDYYPTDKDTTHCYFGIYDDLFLKYREKEINILEVGVSEGGSIRLWSDYFPNAKIFGYDTVKMARPNIFNDRVSYIIKDVNHITDDEFKDTPLTIAIDDGSHTLSHQLFFIKTIYPQLVKGGMLIIEDVQNIDVEKADFKSLNIPFEVIDLRSINNRYDDVLLIFRK